jgi:hypothetical protein
MKRIVTIACLLFSQVVSAETPPITLVCDGTFSDYSDPRLVEIPVKATIFLSERSLRITGEVPYFSDGVQGSTYVITQKSESKFWFRASADPTVNGELDRYTGKVIVSKRKSDLALV